MKKHFYSHIIELSTIHATLDSLGLTVEEKEELIIIAESNIHHIVINTILSELSEDDKKTFLAHIAKDKHEESLQLIKNKIENVEEKIKTAGEALLKELHADIEEAKKAMK